MKRILLNKKSPSYYAEKGRALLDTEQKSKGIAILDKGLAFYPNSVLIHYQYAVFEMDEQHWNEASHHFSFVVNTTNKTYKIPEVYLSYVEALEQTDQITKGIEVLQQGLKQMKSDKMESKLVELLQVEKRWEEATEIVIKSFEQKTHSLPIDQYILLSDLYIEQKEYVRADYILREAIKIEPNNINLLRRYANVALNRQDWLNSLERHKYLLRHADNDDETEFNMLIYNAMLTQLLGEHEKASQLYTYIYNNFQTLINEERDGYRKLTIFDNGESRIEFYKNLKQVNKIVVSFDSLYMNWHEPAFGFKFLQRQDVDIIAVRRREKGSFQQDLTQEDFVSAVKTLVDGYEDKIAYGHSLGGYSALYFASHINCRILSMAPRISIHPIFGRKSVDSKHEFKHNLTNDYNADISPIIVYDPKSKVDNNYIEGDVLKAFPNAILIELPYSGHGIARHLLRMGVLKDFIQTVIDGGIPKYNRKLKGESGNYIRLLGRECLKRGKLNLAINLSARAIDLLPDDKYSIKLQVDVLRKQNKYKEAFEFAKKANKRFPRDVYFYLILIDLYIEQEDLIAAERELKIAISKFGNRKTLVDREEKLSKVRDKIVNLSLDMFNE